MALTFTEADLEVLGNKVCAYITEFVSKNAVLATRWESSGRCELINAIKSFQKEADPITPYKQFVKDLKESGKSSSDFGQVWEKYRLNPTNADIVKRLEEVYVIKTKIHNETKGYIWELDKVRQQKIPDLISINTGEIEGCSDGEIEEEIEEESEESEYETEESEYETEESEEEDDEESHCSVESDNDTVDDNLSKEDEGGATKHPSTPTTRPDLTAVMNAPRKVRRSGWDNLEPMCVEFVSDDEQGCAESKRPTYTKAIISALRNSQRMTLEEIVAYIRQYFPDHIYKTSNIQRALAIWISKNIINKNSNYYSFTPPV